MVYDLQNNETVKHRVIAMHLGDRRRCPFDTAWDRRRRAAVWLPR